MPRTIWIYALIDPRDGEPRYVGKSVNPKARLKQHCGAARYGGGSVAVTRLIVHLMSLGLAIEMRLLEEVPEDRWREAEQHWIDYLSQTARRRLLNRYPAAEAVDHRMVERGSERYNAVMTAITVVQMRQECAAGDRLVDLAARYRLHVSAVSRICRGQAWTHVGGPLTTTRTFVPPARRGAAHHCAKLTPDQVREMRRLYATGEVTTTALARQFGVRQSSAYRIVKGTGWKHIK